MCGAEFFCNMLNAMCTHSLIIDIREEISILSIFIPQRTAVFLPPVRMHWVPHQKPTLGFLSVLLKQIFMTAETFVWLCWIPPPFEAGTQFCYFV